MPTELPNHFNFEVESLEGLYVMVYFFMDEWYKTEGDSRLSKTKPE